MKINDVHKNRLPSFAIPFDWEQIEMNKIATEDRDTLVVSSFVSENPRGQSYSNTWWSYDHHTGKVRCGGNYARQLTVGFDAGEPAPISEIAKIVRERFGRQCTTFAYGKI